MSRLCLDAPALGSLQKSAAPNLDPKLWEPSYTDPKRKGLQHGIPNLSKLPLDDVGPGERPKKLFGWKMEEGPQTALNNTTHPAPVVMGLIGALRPLSRYWGVLGPIWEFPKIRGRQYGPQRVGLSLEGLPKNRPSIFKSKQPFGGCWGLS